MRTRFAVALVLLATLASPRAAASFEKGIKLGADLASFRGDFGKAIDAKVRLGFVGGGWVAMPLAPNLAIQVEGLYTMKGAKATTQGVDEAGNLVSSGDDVWKLNYLEFPVLLRATLPVGGRVRPMLVLGPTLGVSLGGRFESDFGNMDLRDLKPVDFGGAAGLGARVGLGGRELIGEFRYTTGFTDLYDIQGNAESINSVFSFTLGLGF